MSELSRALEELIVKQKSSAEDILYVYLPTGQQFTDPVEAVEELLKDKDQFMQFSSANRPKRRTIPQFKSDLKSAVEGVRFEEEIKEACTQKETNGLNQPADENGDDKSVNDVKEGGEDTAGEDVEEVMKEAGEDAAGEDKEDTAGEDKEDTAGEDKEDTAKEAGDGEGDDGVENKEEAEDDKNSDPKNKSKPKAKSKGAAAVVKSKNDSALYSNWIVCTLPRNMKHVSWSTNDIQEIGRYFFENHANALEVKMNQSDIVYVRFQTPTDADTFVKLPYVMFLGIYVKRKRFRESDQYSLEYLRKLLAAELGVQIDHKPSAESEEKIQMHLSGFQVKFTNSELFTKLAEEIELKRNLISAGAWFRNRDGGTLTWEARVNIELPPEELAKYVVEWNKKEIMMGDSIIKAELVKAKGNSNRGQKRPMKEEPEREARASSIKRSFLESY